MRRIAMVGICFAILLGLVSTGAEDEPLQGFTRANSATERHWETKFRALPSPDNQREYMRRLSARPHHVGSAYDKENAEWILSKYQGVGLGRAYRNLRRAVPHAKRARTRNGRADALHGQAAGTARRSGSHVQPAERTIALLQRVLDRWRRDRASRLRQLRIAQGLRATRPTGSFSQGRNRHREVRRLLARNQAESCRRTRRRLAA